MLTFCLAAGIGKTETKPLSNKHERSRLDKAIQDMRMSYPEFYVKAKFWLGREISVGSMLSNDEIRFLIKKVKGERERLEHIVC